jgi:predicted nucleotidyltransferase
MSPFDEIRSKQPQLEEICRRYGVKELSVFGSALREDFRPDSDYDLLVEFKPEANIGLLELSGMKFAFEDVLGRKVDLVTKRGLKQFIRDNVLRQARVIYAG